MINKCLVIRYGELFLKGENRNDFIKELIDNINLTLYKNNFTNFSIRRLHDQLLITTKNSADLPKILTSLQKVFGISNFYLAYQLISKEEELVNFAENIPSYYEINFASFCLNIKRNDKNFPKNSLILQKELGAIIKKKYNLSVNLTKPERTFFIQIYQQFTLVFAEKIKGLGGLPVGSSGKVLVLLSGGIDSPVAAYQLMKRGLEVVYCHFYYQSNDQKKIISLVEKLSHYNRYCGNVYLVNIQSLFAEISHISQSKYRLVILKRMFMRLACSLAKKLGIKAIATGDSLAQVASQTLESLETVQQANSLLLLQPLITRDKESIIAEAQQIETYDFSVEVYEDCCSLFAPKNPVTRPKKEVAEKLEKELESTFFHWEDILEDIINKKISIINI
ncbi:MAG: tRNA 4-thiouridine(8) synthase ThiI [Spiroplasmataceae bacterium]|jgi:thiamine biosynthesis protein ThiI|nr:tRNA 4-thiouridine(8) synthase ThiI [Spiroplasmataceae bacterium]